VLNHRSFVLWSLCSRAWRLLLRLYSEAIQRFLECRCQRSFSEIF
jgi:hypothetical protein